jgi:hypothetical protein
VAFSTKWSHLDRGLLRRAQLRSRLSWNLSRLVGPLRQQLFVYGDLSKWLDELFEPPAQPIAGCRRNW